MELLGRATEIGAIDSLLDRARHDGGGALVLRGAAGIGLTSLLDYASASSSDMWVLRVAGVEAELRVQYGALHRLLAPEVWWRHRLHVPIAQRLALEHAFGLETRAPVTNGENVTWLAVGLATLTLLARAADDRPVLCAVDDAELLDEQSAVALAVVARRLGADQIAMLFAQRDPSEFRDLFDDLDALDVDRLADSEARTLIDSAFKHRLEAPTREWVLAETAGNPRAILELPSALPTSPTSVLDEPAPLGKRLEQQLVQEVHALSPAAQDVMLLAALHDGSTALFWSAAELLGLDVDAYREAENAGLLHIGARIVFTKSLLRSAVYGEAAPDDRRRVQSALAGAAEATGDDVRAAWYRAAATLEPDEQIAGALFAVAAQVRSRGDPTTAALFLERASALTPDAALRGTRLLAAVNDRLAEGSPGRGAALLAEALALPLSDLQSARAAMMRAQIAQTLGQSSDGATLMLLAAVDIASQDEEEGREALLQALEAAVYLGRFGSGGQVLEAARSALAFSTDDTDAGPDLLLRGLALLFTTGHAPAVPVLRRAIDAVRSGSDLRWLTLAGLAALEIWDDRALEVVVAAETELAGASRLMPVSLNLGYLAGLDHVIAGRFSKAAEWYGDTRVLADIARDPAVAGIADAGSLLVVTWRGDPNEARELIDRCARDAMAAEFGRYYALTRYSLAVLENSLGRYKAALIAAQDAFEGRALYLATFALPELIEAAARSYDRRTAASALDELAARTIPSGTDWGLGMLARSRALLADDAEAESLYREAIERLAESRALPQLARAHLLYGEWLRRQRRRRDAREHLRRAEGMFVAMGAQTFATRTRHELEATGEHVGTREQPLTEVLTPQEARIADLVATGASNPEIGAQLFISPRTVEYHLHKIFGKLGVSSRVELTRVLMEE